MARKSRRREARDKGLKWYFTGTTCVNGHIDERQTSNGVCKSCSYARWNRRYKENSEEFKLKTREYYRDNSITVKEWLEEIIWAQSTGDRDVCLSVAQEVPTFVSFVSQEAEDFVSKYLEPEFYG